MKRAGVETRPYERNSNIGVCRGGPLCPPEKIGRLAGGYTLSGHTTETCPLFVWERALQREEEVLEPPG
jgi:hypothetical protein